MTEQQPGCPEPKREPLSWIPAFLAELAASGVIRRAARAAHIALPTAYGACERHPEFAAAWDSALITAEQNGGRVRAICRTTPPASPPPAPVKPASAHRCARFLEALAETSSVTVSAARANVAVEAVYKLRREDPDFATKWLAALHEGYDHLEMELLGHLRNPQPGRKMDVTSALRLLAAHRATVERQRALTEEEDEEALLESIDRFIDDMRDRRAANEAVLIETGADDGAE
jgi:hypothetical protein